MSAKEFREQAKKAKQELDEMHKANLKKPLPNKFVTTPIFTKWQKDAILVGLSLGLIVTSAVLISNWFDHNRLVWQSPVTFRTPVYAEVRGVAKALPTTSEVQVVPEPTLTATPSPTATPKPEPTPRPETPKQEIIDLIVRVFGEDAPDAFNVLFCENRNLNPNATNHNNNGTIDRGLFQINSIHGGEEMFDPETNVRKAKAIFDKQGWKPWTCSTRIGVKNYLNQ